MTRVLAVNCGSSSVKFLLADAGAAGALQAVDQGKREAPAGTHPIHTLFEELRSRQLLDGVELVGHRVVHGGRRFLAPTLLDAGVLAELKQLSVLAPLHNPPAVEAIAEARKALGPAVPQVATFDTAFHAALPDRAAVYAVPWEWTERLGVRRYGFHGLAHRCLVEGAARALARPLGELRLITLQLGAGCSMAAVQGGRSVDTSMGLTPNEGLVMATRCGDVDPLLAAYVARLGGGSEPALLKRLSTESGLAGISGTSGDMRELLRRAAKGDRRSELAVEVFCYRARKYLGAYLAVLGGADAIAFGGGIGENSPEIRRRILEGMEWAGVVPDPASNQALEGTEGRFSAAGSRVALQVVNVHEEALICRDALAAARMEAR